MEPEIESTHEDMVGHVLTVEETSALFDEANVPRSPRTIRRYCKNGHLDCVLADTEIADRYMVNRASVERRISELKSLVETGHVRLRPDMTGQDQTRPDTSGQVSDELEERVTELENENLNLRIDNRAKEQIIGQMSNERREMISQLTDSSHTIGVLETQMKALEAPKPTLEADDQTTGDRSNPHMRENDGEVEYSDGSGN